MRQPTKACRQHQTSPTRRNPSTHRAAFQRRSCKLHQGSTRILVSRWSARPWRLSRKPTTSDRSQRRRLQLDSESLSTFFAKPALKAILNTCASSMRSGSCRPRWTPSHALGAPRTGGTRNSMGQLMDRVLANDRRHRSGISQVQPRDRVLANDSRASERPRRGR